jgi:hypothetical protein
MDREIVGRSSANVAHHLEGMHFPSSKEDLLVRARDNGAGQDMLEVLESFPSGKKNYDGRPRAAPLILDAQLSPALDFSLPQSPSLYMRSASLRPAGG